jgi:hypothetical protein
VAFPCGDKDNDSS